MTKAASGYGVGIVGCGAIASVHAAALQQIPHARLVSVYSRDPDKAGKLAAEFGVKALNKWEEFIHDPALEMVIICTPSGTHLDYGQLSAEAGKHVITEKPVEVNLQRAEKLIRICAANQVSLAVIYQNRFLPAVIRMKQLLHEQKLGRIFLADACVKWYRSQEYYDSADWRGTLELDGGGVLINQAIHTIDLLQWLVGDVRSVSGHIGTFTHQRIEGEDTAVASLCFENGALGVIEASTSVIPAMARRLEIHGEKGTLSLEDNHLRINIAAGTEIYPPEADGSVPPAGASAPFQNVSLTPFTAQLETIFQAMKNRQQPPVSGPDSLRSLAIVQGIYRSASLGKTVLLKEFYSPDQMK